MTSTPSIAGPTIRNSSELASHGLGDLRATALRVAAEETFSSTDRGVSIDGREYPVSDEARIVVLGSGKATLSIAAALERVLGDRLHGGIVVVRTGEEGRPPLTRIEVLSADHPLPTERSAEGARRLHCLPESST